MRNNLLKSVLIILMPITLFSCAGSYEEIPKDVLNYQAKVSTTDNIKVEYQPNVLKGKYSLNEIKTGVSLITVKITNNTGQDIRFKNDIKIYSEDREISIIPLNSFYDITRQDADKSLWFLALTPLNAYSFSQTTEGSTVTSQSSGFYPIGLILGPALAFGNQAAANGANKKFKKQLEENNILEQTIKNGDSNTGFIGLRTTNIQNLTFKLVKQ